MGSAFHQLCPRYSGTLTPTAPTAIRLWDTFTFYVHEVLVNRLGGLSLPRKSVVRLTDRPDMTLDVYRGRKTTIQQFNITLAEETRPNASAEERM